MHGHLTANYLPDAAKADVLYLYIANGVTTVRAMLGNPEASHYPRCNRVGKTPRSEAVRRRTGAERKSRADAGRRRASRTRAETGRVRSPEILGGMPPQAYDSIMRTAHSLKIDVAGHVPGEVGVRGALDARQRSIDHLDQYIPALKLTPGHVTRGRGSPHRRACAAHREIRRMERARRCTCGTCSITQRPGRRCARG